MSTYAIKEEPFTGLAETVSAVIRSRKTVFADELLPDPVAPEIIEEILTDAIWAPTHKLTQPWHFVVADSRELRADFGRFMLDYYQKKYTIDQFPPSRYEDTLSYPLNGGTIVFLMMRRSERADVLPEWEELAAVSCAAQNIWLSCTARGLGTYWDTASATIAFGERFITSDLEQCLGCFFIGYYEEARVQRNRKRKPLYTKLTWIK